MSFENPGLVDAYERNAASGGLIGNAVSPLEKALQYYQQQKRLNTQDARADADLKLKGLIKNDSGGYDLSQAAQQKQQAESAQYDPTSTLSALTRQQVAKYKLDVPENASAADLQPIATQAEKFQAAQDRAANTGLLRDQMAKNRSDAQDAKEQARLDKLEKDAADDFDPSKGRNGQFGETLKRRQALDRADVIMQQHPDGNLNTTQSTEFATAVASVMSNGTPQSQHQIEMLIPKSYKGDWNKFLGALTNNPQGLEQQKFILSLKDTLDRERDLSTNQLVGMLKQKSTKHQMLNEQAPDRYERTLQGALDPYGISLDDLKSYDYKKGLAKKDAGQGLLPGGAPAVQGKPKTINQNGFIYTLNPTTGQYE